MNHRNTQALPSPSAHRSGSRWRGSVSASAAAGIRSSGRLSRREAPYPQNARRSKRGDNGINQSINQFYLLNKIQ